MGRWEVLGSIPHKRAILKAAQALREGKVILYPTDTTYAMGCLLSEKGAFETLCRIRQVRPDKSLFSVFLPEVRAIGQYALGVDTPTYRLLKRLWPGPYTVILRAGSAVPRHLWHRRTLGFRVTDYPIVSALLEEVGEPIVTAGVPDGHLERYLSQVAEALDAGPLPEGLRTTVLDLSEGLGSLRVLRRGIGPLTELEPFFLDLEPFQEA